MSSKYCLTILENNADFYFVGDYIRKGDLIKISGYRVFIIEHHYSLPYIYLYGKLVNEGEVIITKMDLC